MAAYDGERYVADAVRSVLAQTFRDLELIVVDDGSTDRTSAIVEEIAATDGRVRLVRRANSGRPAIARNDGIALASGRYLSFLDCDDWYEPERTKCLVEGLDAHPHWVAAFHDLRFVTSDGTPMPGSYLTDAAFLESAGAHLTEAGDGWYESRASFYVFQSLRYAAMHTQSVMIAAERVAPESLRFDPQFLICEDTDLWIRIGMQGPTGYLDRVLSGYRQHSSSITVDSERRCREMVGMHAHNFARIQGALDAGDARRYRAKLAGLAADLAYARVVRGDGAGARAAWAEALRWRWSTRSLLGYAKACLPTALLSRRRPAAP
jgi:GT2 family glycosyltransferase